MAKILALKRFFKASKEELPAYKQFHFLNKLPAEKIREIVLFSESEKLLNLMPELGGKKVLFFNDQHHRFALRKIAALEVASLLNYIFAGEPEQTQTSGMGTVYGNVDRLPFRHMHFDVIVCPFALLKNNITQEMIAALSRCLKNGGRMVISLTHPQLEHLLYNQNPAQNASLDNSLSKYFKMFKTSHLFTEEIEESSVDAALKPFFTVEGEQDHYHEYKGTPLTLQMRLVKFVKTAAKK